MERNILNKIQAPEDLRKLDQSELCMLIPEIRDYLIEIVSTNGGHLASSLGVVELTIALHYVFDTPHDKLIWDVGHQAYPHKILTGRRDRFKTIRQYGGLSGFPNIKESEYDSYNVGHSSTSLSLAFGEAVARDLKKENYHVIPIIGDGAMTGGMAYEAMNMIGELNKKLLIILNDNNMSISPNVGAISRYFNRLLVNPTYNRLRRLWYSFLRSIPRVGKKISGMAEGLEWRMKHIIIPGVFFEELGIRYIGPIDGHNLPALIKLFGELRESDNEGPTLLHLITKKGNGYRYAEENAVVFHGLGPFEKKSGKVFKKREQISYSNIFGDKILELGKRDKSVIAITAAMCEGTGLFRFSQAMPERFFDVGIAEQNAVTFAASLAARGFKPYIAIYSTFLQRSFDQIIHDVANMNLPVKFVIDRAGLVGEDGPTHHGVFDISFLRPIPNLVLLSPKDGKEFLEMLEFMNQYDKGPIAIRTPRGGVSQASLKYAGGQPIEIGKSELIRRGKDLTIFSYGPFYELAVSVERKLRKLGLEVGIVNLRFLKPLDISLVDRMVSESAYYITLEDGSRIGGVGECINSSLDPALRSREIFRGAYPDEFITHGDNKKLMADCGLTGEAITQKVIEFLEKNDKSGLIHLSDRKKSKAETGTPSNVHVQDFRRVVN